MEENKMPTLTLDPFNEAEVQEEVKKEEVTQESDLDEAKLSPEEKQLVNDFSEKIDITNSQMVLQYGASAQTKISNFSESTLDKVRTKDLGEVGDMVSSLVGELKSFDVDEQEKKGVFGFLKKSKNKVDEIKAKYTKVGSNVEKITHTLEKHQVTLLKDIAMLDQMYELNMSNYKELTLYILAGKKKLEKAKNEELPKLVSIAQASNLPEDSQKANDYASMVNRFEKKLHDLELTRIIAIQMAPQIRLVQNNDTLMAEKIQSVIVNTIPLWKSQMVLALGLQHSKEAMEAQRSVTEMTNELLKKNADTLKMGTIETAKESERGIVDIETLKHTNQSLIETLDEVVKIQNEGREKRTQAEVELKRIEGELKQKLLDIRS
ncbi:MAG: toxic anion resistance protein [Erysipelotrichaceae bacterium]|nr:toxic anion resistance protein [Erysipelotrichaceae bacterium]